MKFLSANGSNNDVTKFNKSVKNGDTVFVMFHSPSCGHCAHTLPVWNEIESMLKGRYEHNDDVMVADIRDDVLDKTDYANKIEGYPTMWCISKKGAKIEPIENVQLTNEPRTISAFIEWIELKTPASYNSPTESSNKKKKKKYRVTPYPHSHSRQKRSRRHSTKKGGKKTKRMKKY
jgi:thiol-disulfide isomerase/thioredoxin